MSPAQIARELIDAADALMEVMYNSDMEAGWQPQRDRWRAAQETAMAQIPGLKELTEVREAEARAEWDRLNQDEGEL